MAESWTVLRLLTWTTDYLKSHGSESPRLDAEVLLAQARGCERISLYTAFDEVVSDEIRGKYREMVKRRAEGVPVAYLVGKREFYSLPFRVTPDVLIPRPETEFVVVATLDAIGGQSRKSKVESRKPETPDDAADLRPSTSDLRQCVVCDVGTGSGAIAVAIAKHAPQVRVTAIDISPAALAVARENAAANQVADRIEFIAGDLLAPLPAEPRFTVIASNPPYIGEGEISTLSPSVIKHEPRTALIAGPTGTEIIERLIPQAAERLLPGGWLILEISPLIVSRVIELIAAQGSFEPATIAKDLAGLARVVKARRH
jgi:release factor glutamine methyltransferase